MSGVSFLTGVILIRALGLETFGVYALVMVGVQFLAGVQQSLILSPLMSLFEQRGEVTPARYLAAVLLHQCSLMLLILVGLVVAWQLPDRLTGGLPLSLATAVVLVTCVQFQEFARRWFFVTDRPQLAVLCDAVAHGGRLLAIAGLAVPGLLTLETVWIIMICTSTAGFLFLVPDVLRAAWHAPAVIQVTRRHRALSGWMTGNMVVAWFSESGFLLIVVGGTLGAAEVGAVRAVQNLILVVNLLIQSLENFVPSTASRRLVDGGPSALVSYLAKVGSAGGLGILLVTTVLVVLATPVMNLVYSHPVPGQEMILGAFGIFLAMGYINSVVFAGLRALSYLHSAFLVQLLVSAACVALMAPAAHAFGLAGALCVLLGARVVMTTMLVRILRGRTRTLAGEAAP